MVQPAEPIAKTVTDLLVQALLKNFVKYQTRHDSHGQYSTICRWPIFPVFTEIR
jgi:hypothetical protein